MFYFLSGWLMRCRLKLTTVNILGINKNLKKCRTFEYLMCETTVIRHQIFYTRVIIERFQSSALLATPSSYLGGAFAIVYKSAIIISDSVPIS